MNEREFSRKRTTLGGWGYRHLMRAYKDVGMCRPLRIKAKCKMRGRSYKTEWKFRHKIGGERGKTCSVSRHWFHFAMRPSTRTFAVLAVVSRLDTVTNSFLLRKQYFLMLGTLTARRTKQNISNHRGIKESGLINKHEPVTSTRCSDRPRD